ncbi:hypothetical protein V5799_027660 [Amblyomma americanum]|uniref:Uncharacterized protein n=1 Tax=Amblyomma americanum TaxID=6943 RepID=A0AAQ4DF32_AMBAM
MAMYFRFIVSTSPALHKSPRHRHGLQWAWQHGRDDIASPTPLFAQLLVPAYCSCGADNRTTGDGPVLGAYLLDDVAGPWRYHPDALAPTLGLSAHRFLPQRCPAPSVAASPCLPRTLRSWSCTSGLSSLRHQPYINHRDIVTAFSGLGSTGAMTSPHRTPLFAQLLVPAYCSCGADNRTTGDGPVLGAYLLDDVAGPWRYHPDALAPTLGLSAHRFLPQRCPAPSVAASPCLPRTLRSWPCTSGLSSLRHQPYINHRDIVTAFSGLGSTGAMTSPHRRRCLRSYWSRPTVPAEQTTGLPETDLCSVLTCWTMWLDRGDTTLMPWLRRLVYPPTGFFLSDARLPLLQHHPAYRAPSDHGHALPVYRLYVTSPT